MGRIEEKTDDSQSGEEVADDPLFFEVPGDSAAPARVGRSGSTRGKLKMPPRMAPDCPNTEQVPLEDWIKIKVDEARAEARKDKITAGLAEEIAEEARQLQEPATKPQVELEQTDSKSQPPSRNQLETSRAEG